MQLPGLLIEYLIGGTVALIWVVPLLGLLDVNLPASDRTSFLGLVPALYVVGMIVDFVGLSVVSWCKKQIRTKVWTRMDLTCKDIKMFYTVDVMALLHSKELYQAIEVRSSRDRVARDTIVNLFLATVLISLYLNHVVSSFPIWISILIGALLVLVAWLMWERFQKASDLFNAKAYWLLGKSENIRTSKAPKT